MMERLALRIRDLDRRLFRKLFRLKWPPLTFVMRAFTVLGTAGSLWGVLAAGAFLVGGLRLWHLLVPWGAVALSWTLAEGAKHLVDRARPSTRDSGIAPLTKIPSSSSFPSGHAATAVAGVITLSALYPASAPALALAGALVILSRVYLGVHYPLDVLGGMGIGLFSALLFLGW